MYALPPTSQLYLLLVDHLTHKSTATSSIENSIHHHPPKFTTPLRKPAWQAAIRYENGIHSYNHVQRQLLYYFFSTATIITDDCTLKTFILLKLAHAHWAYTCATPPPSSAILARAQSPQTHIWSYGSEFSRVSPDRMHASLVHYPYAVSTTVCTNKITTWPIPPLLHSGMRWYRNGCGNL